MSLLLSKRGIEMVKEIVKDPIFLAQKSEEATPEDEVIGRDLIDTLRENSRRCVGMAANMIGVAKRVIAFDNNGTYMIMYNPEIVKCEGRYQTEEGCLSLDGIRQTLRWSSIKVKYQNEAFQTRFKTFSGWTAQIIQHEIDHCNGILI